MPSPYRSPAKPPAPAPSPSRSPAKSPPQAPSPSRSPAPSPYRSPANSPHPVPSPYRSPAKSPPPPLAVVEEDAFQWVCPRCTLFNYIWSASCDACTTARPVEVDANSPAATLIPLGRGGRKRERADSPDVVEVCDGPSGGGVGKAPAAGKGNLETRLDKKTFKIMTYNVWFREDLELRMRMDALGDLIKHHSPDFICFQEVTPYIYLVMQESGWWKQYKCLLSYATAQRQYYCMQLSKLSVEPSDCIPFPNTTMGRELCMATIFTGGMTKLVVATTHLESPMPAPPTWDQMYKKERVFQANKSLEILGGLRNVIFCGDMNWDDKKDGPFPLPDGWIDAWVQLKPGEEGWTYDTKANGMLSGNRKLQKRLDRFVCKLEDFKIDSIEMIGKEAIPGVSYFKEKKVRKEFVKIELPVFPSDHFGLVLTVTQKEDGDI